MQRIDVNPAGINDTRRNQLARLVERLGSRRALLDAVGRSDYQAKPACNAQILSAWLRNNRPFGSDVCRRLEATLGLPRGWFDTPPVNDAELTLPLLDATQSAAAIAARAIAPARDVPRVAVPVDAVHADRFATSWMDASMSHGPDCIAPGACIVASIVESFASEQLVLAVVGDQLLLRRYYEAGPTRLLLPSADRYGAGIDIGGRLDVPMARVVMAITTL